MDVSAFSDDNFEVKDWINKTFKSAEAQENEAAFVSSLVMKLQLYVQQVNSALEDTSQQVLHSLPRVMRDTEILHQEAILLRDKMQAVKQEIAKIEKDTGQSMASLERTDRMKTELQTAEQALHEADNWTVLATDMEEVFESSDIELIASKLVSMQQSLHILANVHDHEEKKLQLEGLKNRLEAMASPLLVQAFTCSSVEQSQVYARIFMDMGRLPQLLKYYHKCQKNALLQTWRNIVEAEQDEGVAEWMTKFYDAFVSNWQHQVKWTGQVFPSSPPLDTLLGLHSDVLGSLEPSLNECIDAALKQQSDPLGFLTELKQTTRRFAYNLELAVDSSRHGTELRSDLVLALAKAVYAPYVVYVSKYYQLEHTLMTQQLAALSCAEEQPTELVQGLSQCIPRAMAVPCDALKRCLQLTEGCGFTGLVRAVKVCLSNYLDQYRVALRRLERQRTSAEDWGSFQTCLTLLQTVGVLLTELKQLDSDLQRALSDLGSKADGSSAFTRFRALLLNDKGREELNALILAQREDQVSLLESVIASAGQLCSDIHRATYQAVYAPVSAQLELVACAPAWSKHAPTLAPDLPAFSYAPQEYVTQVGQYLMTLPQHLEPFLLQDNPALTLALKVADEEYVAMTTDGGFADVLLGIVARGTCQSYCESILSIVELSPGACKQLASDIDYLGNVLEDLGLGLSEHLQQVTTLLRLGPEEYQSKSSGCSARLVAAVRQMRGLTFSA